MDEIAPPTLERRHRVTFFLDNRLRTSMSAMVSVVSRPEKASSNSRILPSDSSSNARDSRRFSPAARPLAVVSRHCSRPVSPITLYKRMPMLFASIRFSLLDQRIGFLSDCHVLSLKSPFCHLMVEHLPTVEVIPLPCRCCRCRALSPSLCPCEISLPTLSLRASLLLFGTI